MAESAARVQLGSCDGARAKVTRCGFFRVSIIGGQDLKGTEQRPRNGDDRLQYKHDMKPKTLDDRLGSFSAC